MTKDAFISQLKEDIADEFASAISTSITRHGPMSNPPESDPGVYFAGVAGNAHSENDNAAQVTRLLST